MTQFKRGSTYSDYHDERQYIEFPSGKKVFLEDGYSLQTIEGFVEELNELAEKARRYEDLCR